MTMEMETLPGVLTEDRDLFRRVVESSPSGMVVVDERGTIQLVNAEAERLFGYDRSELVGRTVDVLVPERLRGRHGGYREAFMAAPSVRRMGIGRDLFGLRRDGTEFPIEVGLNPIETASGMMVIAGIVDISARKEAQELFRLAVESSPNGVVMMDDSGIILLVNAETERLFGYERDELLGRPIEVLVPQRLRDGHPAVRAAFLKNPATRDMGAGRELFGLRRDGTEFPIEVGLNPIETPDGVRVLAAVVDISRRRQAEAELAQRMDGLRQAQKLEALGQLAGGIAHDFNNLLAAISGYGELLVAALDDRSDLRADALEILQASHQATEMVRQLLAFSRRQALAPETVDLNVVINDLLRIFARLVREHVRVRTDLGREPLIVVADRGQVGQVLINLIVNARDAMPEGGTVTIGTTLGVMETEGGSRAAAVVRVSDEGTGIDSATMEHIFEPFFTTKPAGEGTGLGLSTVYGIVSQAGGDIAVESEPGRGTTFTIKLPLVAPQRSTGTTAIAEPDAPEGSGLVLLVEDEEAVRAVTRRILERQGYTVIEAAHAGEALEIAAATLASLVLVLTDVSLPDLSGPALVQQLRVTRAGLPVLFMSGYSDQRLQGHYGLDPRRVLRKPFQSMDLSQAVAEAMGHRRGA